MEILTTKEDLIREYMHRVNKEAKDIDSRHIENLDAAIRVIVSIMAENESKRARGEQAAAEFVMRLGIGERKTRKEEMSALESDRPLI